MKFWDFCNFKVFPEMTFARPIVSVFPSNDSTKATSSIPLPTVFVSPLRHDLVRYVFTNMSKNKRQAYGVSTKAGKFLKIQQRKCK